MAHANIIGHATQIAELAQDIERDNVAHAYLFVGPPHVGKMTTARWFATELLTDNVTGEERERAEHEVERLLHPDFFVLDQLWIEDQSDDFDQLAKTTNIPQQHRSKAPKIMKTDTISIDDVRVIQDRLMETGGPRRVCIIRSVERMRDEAANAFLKLLEEPPPGRVFIFTALSTGSVLPTILSRCRVVRFERVPDALVRPLLAESDDEETRFILHLAQGAPGAVKRLLSDPDSLREERLMHTQALSFWGTTSVAERLKLLLPLEERGEAADRFLLHLALALRESPDRSRAGERLLLQLLSRLETNANRPILLQDFALQLSPV